nr:hypothetical protein [Zhejiang mosquito virus 3]
MGATWIGQPSNSPRSPWQSSDRHDVPKGETGSGRSDRNRHSRLLTLGTPLPFPLLQRMPPERESHSPFPTIDFPGRLRNPMGNGVENDQTRPRRLCGDQHSLQLSEGLKTIEEAGSFLHRPFGQEGAVEPRRLSLRPNRLKSPRHFPERRIHPRRLLLPAGRALARRLLHRGRNSRPASSTWAKEGVFPGGRCRDFAYDGIFERNGDTGTARHRLKSPCGNGQRLTQLPSCPVRPCRPSTRKVGVTGKDRVRPRSLIRRDKSTAGLFCSAVSEFRGPRTRKESHLLLRFVAGCRQSQARALKAKLTCRGDCRCEPLGVRETRAPQFSGVEQRHSRTPEVCNKTPVNGQQSLGHGAVEPGSLELGQARCSSRRYGDIIWNGIGTGGARTPAKEGANRNVASHTNGHDLRCTPKAASVPSTAVEFGTIELSKQGRRTVSTTDYIAPLLQLDIRTAKHSYLKGPLSQYKGIRASEALEAVGLPPGRGDKVFVPSRLTGGDSRHEVIASSYRGRHVDQHRRTLRGTRQVGHCQVVQVEYRPRDRKAHHTTSFAQALDTFPRSVQLGTCRQGTQVRVRDLDRAEQVPSKSTQGGGRSRTQSVAETVPYRPAHVKRHEIRGGGKVCAVELGGTSTDEGVGQVIVEGVEDLGSWADTRQVDPTVPFEKGPDGLPAGVSGHHCPGRRLRHDPRLHTQLRNDCCSHRDRGIVGCMFGCSTESAVRKDLQVVRLGRRGQQAYGAAVCIERVRVPHEWLARHRVELVAEQLLDERVVFSHCWELTKLRKLAALQRAHRCRSRPGEVCSGIRKSPAARSQSLPGPDFRPRSELLDERGFRVHWLGQNLPMLSKAGDGNLCRADRHCPPDSCELSEVKPTLPRTGQHSVDISTLEGPNGEAARRLTLLSLQRAGTTIVGVLLDLLGGEFNAAAGHGVSYPAIESLDRFYGGYCFRRQAVLLKARQQYPQRKAEGVPNVLRLLLRGRSRGFGRCLSRSAHLLRRVHSTWRGLRVHDGGGDLGVVGLPGQPFRTGLRPTNLGTGGLVRACRCPGRYGSAHPFRKTHYRR